MNNNLKELYYREIEKIDKHLKEYNIKSSLEKKATNPFLISVPENYNSFENSIMIFGQETNYWCYECGKKAEYSKNIEKSLEIYETFYINGGINKYRGPFWNEFKRIKRETNKTKNAYFIWNNINKIGRMGKGNIPEIDKLQFDHFNVIKDEIKILKPRILIFLTGNDYNHFIRKNISNFKEVKISDFISQIYFEGDFEKLIAFKTFHPNALYMKSKNKIVIPNLINLIKEACI